MFRQESIQFKGHTRFCSERCRITRPAVFAHCHFLCRHVARKLVLGQWQGYRIQDRFSCIYFRLHQGKVCENKSMNPKPLEQSQRAQKNRRDHYALCSVCGLLGQHKQTIVFEAPERGTENGLPAPESQWHRLGCSVLCPQLAL